MFEPALAVVLAVLLLLGFLAWKGPSGFGRRRELLRRQAQTIRRRLDRIFAEAHDYEDADWEALSDLDREFYDRTQTRLEREGFRPVGDVEDVTASAVMPEMRTITRALVGDDGTVIAGVVHVRVRGFRRLLAGLAQVPADVRTVELRSELADGRVLTTNDAAGLPGFDGPEWNVERLEPGTPLEDLLARHRARVREALAGDGKPEPLRFRDRRAVEEATRRLWQRSAHAYRDRGGPSREEWVALFGRPTPLVDEMWEELASAEAGPLAQSSR